MTTFNDIRNGNLEVWHHDAYVDVVKALDKHGNSKEWMLAVLYNLAGILNDEIEADAEALKTLVDSK